MWWCPSNIDPSFFNNNNKKTPHPQNQPRIKQLLRLQRKRTNKQINLCIFPRKVWAGGRNGRDLFDIVAIKIVTRLATINASAFSVDAGFTKFEPALSSGAVGGSDTGGSEASDPILETQKARTELRDGRRRATVYWCEGEVEGTQCWSHSSAASPGLPSQGYPLLTNNIFYF